jgi:hypothetical protein
MTVIAHEACPRCYRTADDVGSDEDGPGCGDYLNCPGTMTAFVPADQLKGAVSDLRELCEALEGVQMVGGRRGGKTRLNEAWKRARARLDGGQ